MLLDRQASAAMRRASINVEREKTNGTSGKIRLLKCG